MKYIPRVCLSILLTLFACHNSSQDAKQKPAATSFARDLQFLQHHDSIIVLRSGDAQVIVSPKFQGKIFTSTTDGMKSFGWINYKAFDAPLDPHMNAYGGENRLWLGPEGGIFSLFFPKDADMEFANWKTPAPFDSEAWTVISKSSQAVQLSKDMRLINYTGMHFDISITRKIGILDNRAINRLLQLVADTAIKAVGYETENTISNTGKLTWTEQTGTPCLWTLDMFNPSPSTTIIIPYTETGSKPVTTDYFGEIAADRISYKNGVLFFKADGKSRGKLGIHPAAAKNIAGSYDSENNILTITLFDVDTKASYLNQEWNTTKPPFSGDAVNAYNDGPLARGKQMGPFYELESVSPAAFLKPGGSLTHRHSVFHFTGKEEGLDRITFTLLGVRIDQIKNTLQQHEN